MRHDSQHLEMIGVAEAGGSPQLKNVSFDFGRGARILVVGANGAGKSTLLSILGALAALVLHCASFSLICHEPREYHRHISRAFQSLKCSVAKAS